MQSTFSNYTINEDFFDERISSTWFKWGCQVYSYVLIFSSSTSFVLFKIRVESRSTANIHQMTIENKIKWRIIISYWQPCLRDLIIIFRWMAQRKPDRPHWPQWWCYALYDQSSFFSRKKKGKHFFPSKSKRRDPLCLRIPKLREHLCHHHIIKPEASSRRVNTGEGQKRAKIA